MVTDAQDAAPIVPAWVKFAPAETQKHSRKYWRSLNRPFTLSELREHRYRDDAWIAVDGNVYDITEHIVSHPGWHNAGISTILSIMAHVGSECSEEFHQLHRSYPIAYTQMKAFYIGVLAPS